MHSPDCPRSLMPLINQEGLFLSSSQKSTTRENQAKLRVASPIGFSAHGCPKKKKTCRQTKLTHRVTNVYNRCSLLKRRTKMRQFDPRNMSSAEKSALSVKFWSYWLNLTVWSGIFISLGMIVLIGIESTAGSMPFFLVGLALFSLGSIYYRKSVKLNR